MTDDRYLKLEIKEKQRVISTHQSNIKIAKNHIKNRIHDIESLLKKCDKAPQIMVYDPTFDEPVLEDYDSKLECEICGHKGAFYPSGERVQIGFCIIHIMENFKSWRMLL